MTEDNYEYKIDFTHNFITIDQFLELKTIDKLKRPYALQISAKKTIKCKVDRTSNIWVLEMKVADDWSTKTLDVSFADEIIAKFAKTSAQEISFMYEKATTQPQVREEILKIIHRVSRAIQHKKFLVEVKTKGKSPVGYEDVITRIFQNTDENKRAIKLKVHDEDISKVD